MMLWLFPLFFQAYENNEEMKLRARGETSQNSNTLAGDKVLLFRVFAKKCYSIEFMT